MTLLRGGPKSAALLAIVLLLAACGPRPYGGGAGPPSPTPAASADVLPSPDLSPSQTTAPSPTALPTATPTPEPAPTPSGPQPPVLAERAIVVSLTDQHLWLVEQGKVVFETAVTTGQPALPTPTGDFSVIEMKSPIHWISPWPPGSPYYFPPTLWSQQGLLFRDGGYWIHDAPWQTHWGPGANLITGSHGCVNVPVGAMPTIYAWAAVGTAVAIRA
jgi:lipoprotein-anchoring transpeptidase ErfK/SrfK